MLSLLTGISIMHDWRLAVLALLVAGVTAAICMGVLGAFALNDRARKNALEHLHAAYSAAETARLIALEHQEWAAMAEEAAQVGHWRLDTKTNVSTWSAAVFRIYGLEPSAVAPPAEAVAQLYGPEEWARALEALDRVATTGEAFSLDHRLVRLNGEMRFVSVRGTAQRDRNGEVSSIIGLVIDVTEAKLAEKALRENEARLRFLTDNSADTIVRHEADGRVLFVSEGARQRGWLPSSLSGKSVFDHVHPGDLARVQSALEAFRAETDADRILTTEQRVLTADGDWVWTEAATSAIRDERGLPLEFVTVVRDITQRKTMEDALRRRQAEAEAAALAKSEFLANMSHEIRTPLTAIIGFSGLLEQVQALPADAQLYVKRIVNGGRSLLAVVNDILDFSKLEAGQVTLDPQPFDPADFIADAVALVAAQADAKRLDLRPRLGDGLPALIVADSSRLRQVLLNILSNAIKFTDAGGVTVAADYDLDGARLRVVVTDTGAGVPADKIGRLFERFAQADGSIRRQHGGTGLGLAICKNLVELMGGEITVDSEEGAGTTVRFAIPAPVVVTPAAQVPAPLKMAALPTAQHGHILVVDDLDVNRELVRTLLAAMGFSIAEASSGDDAVKAAGDTLFDLILMDMQMPGMDGLTATRIIRTTANPNAMTPIVALTANVLNDQVEQCLAAGMNDHIGKPIKLDELVQKVAIWGARSRDHGGQCLGASAGQAHHEDNAVWI